LDLFTIDMEGCQDQCDRDENCVGFSTTQESFEFPSRCLIHTENLESMPAFGWRASVVTDQLESSSAILSHSGDKGVHCYSKINKQLDSIFVGFNPIDRERIDSGTGMQLITEYAIPSDGKLISWEFFASRADSVILQVWRESLSEALSFFMVGYTIVDASYGFNQFEADISVQKGDVIGWYCSGIQPIKFDTDVGTVRRVYGFDGLTSPISMAGHKDGWSRTYSVRAEIDLDVGAEIEYPQVTVVDVGFGTQNIEDIRVICSQRGAQLVSVQDAGHVQYLKEQLLAQKGDSYFTSGMGTALGYMYNYDHHVYDLNDPTRSLDQILKDAVTQGYLTYNQGDSGFAQNQPWAGFGWGSQTEIHDWGDHTHHAVFCEEIESPYPSVTVIDAGFETSTVDQIQSVCTQRGQQLVSLQDAEHIEYLKNQLLLQKGNDYFTSGQGTPLGFMYNNDHIVYDLNDPSRDLTSIFSQAMTLGYLTYNEADPSHLGNQPWAGFGWGSTTEIHDWGGYIKAIFCEDDYIVDIQRASNHHVCSGYNSEGHHISLKQCQDLCNDQQGCVGIFGAFNTDNPNSVSGNGACYSCQSFDYGEIGWANTLLWKPTERTDSFSFDLRGRDGSERVRIDDGVIVRELVLSKEWTAFATLSRFVQVSFENDDGSRDVYFRSNFDAEIQLPEVWVDWNCGFLNDLTEEENSRCQTVRSGYFAWRGDYQVEFIGRN